MHGAESSLLWGDMVETVLVVAEESAVQEGGDALTEALAEGVAVEGRAVAVVARKRLLLAGVYEGQPELCAASPLPTCGGTPG